MKEDESEGAGRPGERESGETSQNRIEAEKNEK